MKTLCGTILAAATTCAVGSADMENQIPPAKMPEAKHVFSMSCKGDGAERGRFELMPCGVSRHEFHKDGKEFTIYINTKGETVSVPESNLTLAPHELRICEDGIPHA